MKKGESDKKAEDGKKKSAVEDGKKKPADDGKKKVEDTKKKAPPPKKLLIIDCDCGIDDALAILLAFAHSDMCEILAITCCYGTTTIENVCDNVRKVLQFCNETKIPVYKGSDRPLVYPYKVPSYHGRDGFGNIGHEYQHDSIKLAKGHAANALVYLARAHKYTIHLVVLGPMTNVAMAHRLDPDFTDYLKSIHFMGGNVSGIGNTSSAAEFNFFCDPEAANIVVSESKCPITMIPWETTVEHRMALDVFEKWLATEDAVSNFFRRISEGIQKCKAESMNFVDCDFIAMACLLYPSCIKAAEFYPVSVETTGYCTRGQAIIERRLGRHVAKQIIVIITEIQTSVINNLRNKMVNRLKKKILS